MIAIVIFVFSSTLLTQIYAQNAALCNSLNFIESDSSDTDIKSQGVRALCTAIYPPETKSYPHDHDDETFPRFDVSQVQSNDEMEEILKRFRRARGSSSGGRSGGGSRSSSSRSSGGSRFFGGSRSSSSSSSSSGSRIFSRSSSSSSGGSRIFSRSSSSSSDSGGSRSRFFSRSSSSSSDGSGRSRIFSRSSSSSDSSSNQGMGIFSRNPTSSNTGHRVREAVRTMIRRPATSAPVSAGGVISGQKPSVSDKIRTITGGSGNSRMGFSGGSFGSGSGTGGSSWVRAGKKFLPVAVRFGKRYYQRRKYNKAAYAAGGAAAGAGAGYYAGSRMGSRHYYHHNNNYGYPPTHETIPDQIDGQTPTVFYCIQEDLNATLVNQTLSDEGLGVCNISGKLVTCPVEIECKLSEADSCCEDEQGTPYCCGGPIPEEYSSYYGGYSDDPEDSADSTYGLLNRITATCGLLATICFTVWYQK